MPFRKRQGTSLKRREFITLLSGGAASWPPVVSEASIPAASRRFSRQFVNTYALIAYPLTSLIFKAFAVREVRMAAFRKALGESGYVESQNVLIVYLLKLRIMPRKQRQRGRAGC